MTVTSFQNREDDESSTEDVTMQKSTASSSSVSSPPKLNTLDSATARCEGDKTNCFSAPNGNIFNVRGLHYLKDGKKFPSENNMFIVRGVDFFMSDCMAPAHIGRHPDILDGKLRDKPTFLINFRFPWGVLVLYFEIAAKFLPVLRKKYGYVAKGEDGHDEIVDETDYLSPHDKAVYDFIMGDDNYKNSKLKLIPRVVEGNILVRKLVGKPIIIGRRLPITYIYEPADEANGLCEYLEADLDIGNSTAKAKKIVGVMRNSMSTLAVDIGFVIEGGCLEQLPERMLACARIHKLDAEKSPTLTWA